MAKLRRNYPFWPPIILMAITVGIRIMYSQDIWVPIQGDAGSYFAAARNLAAHGFYGIHSAPDALRPPFYSVLFAIVVKLLALDFTYWAYTGLNCAIDALSVFLLYVIARRIAPGLGTWGILFVSISPLWIGHVDSPITEPSSVMCFLLFLERWTKEKRKWTDIFLSGIYLGFLTLTRSMFIWFPLGLIAFELVQRKAPKGARIDGLVRLAFIAGAYLPPVIWGLRNYRVMGKFLITQDASTAILMAWLFIKIPGLDWRMQETHDFHAKHPWGDVLLGHASSERTVEIMAKMKQEVIDMVTQEPLEYLSLMGPKILRLWVTGWWNPYNYLYSPPYLSATYVWVFCLPILVFGCVGLFHHWNVGSIREKDGGIAISRWRATRVQLFLVLYITGVTFPSTVDARYSLIAYVTFCLWFGVGLMRAIPPRDARI